MKHEPPHLSDHLSWLDECERLEYEDKIQSRQLIESLLRLLFKLNLWDTRHQNDAYSTAREIANGLYD
jgi:hypothetical protein